ncbi:MAG: ATP-binding protein [Hamadaea sp.]|nr:ATP-binding protein [Hamadaea sp.]
MAEPDGATTPVTGRAVQLDLAFDARALYQTRAAVAAWADRRGIGGRPLEALLIIASELASNAIVHGGGRGRLRLWEDGPRVVCEVSDTGPGLGDPQTAGHRRPEPQERGGRGLWIVRRLAEEFVVHSAPTGATLTATLALGAPAHDG